MLKIARKMGFKNVPVANPSATAAKPVRQNSKYLPIHLINSRQLLLLTPYTKSSWKNGHKKECKRLAKEYEMSRKVMKQKRHHCSGAVQIGDLPSVLEDLDKLFQVQREEELLGLE